MLYSQAFIVVIDHLSHSIFILQELSGKEVFTNNHRPTLSLNQTWIVWIDVNDIRIVHVQNEGFSTILVGGVDYFKNFTAAKWMFSKAHQINVAHSYTQLIGNYAWNIYDYAAITIKNGQKCNLDNCRLFSRLRHVFFCLFVIIFEIRLSKTAQYHSILEFIWCSTTNPKVVFCTDSHIIDAILITSHAFS